MQPQNSVNGAVDYHHLLAHYSGSSLQWAISRYR
jgi:hypothetical protein